MSTHRRQQVPGAPPHLPSAELMLPVNAEVCGMRRMLESKCN